MKLNIGSGQRRFDTRDGWINVDCVSRDDQIPDVICNVGKQKIPFEDSSASVVVLHHVLEHFGCGEATALLGECRRVLTFGGSLIVCVPDMKALAKRWLEGGISDFIFMVNAYGAYQGEEGDRHKWGYSPESLTAYLRDAAQWNAVKPFNWREIPGASIAMDWWILGMECEK